MMKDWIVRVVRAEWFRTDYVGTYPAVSAIAALTLAGKDRYLRVVMDKRVLRLEAVVATEL